MKQTTFYGLVQVRGWGRQTSQCGRPTSKTQVVSSQILDKYGCGSGGVSQIFSGEVCGTRPKSVLNELFHSHYKTPVMMAI